MWWSEPHVSKLSGQICHLHEGWESHIERVCRNATAGGQAQRGRGFPFRGLSFHPDYGGKGRGSGFRVRNSTIQVVFDPPAHDSTYYGIYLSGALYSLDKCADKLTTSCP